MTAGFPAACSLLLVQSAQAGASHAARADGDYLRIEADYLRIEALADSAINSNSFPQFGLPERPYQARPSGTNGWHETSSTQTTREM
jgi:hypothetical protein